MNLLALRIGLHNNYWSSIGNFFNPKFPRCAPSGRDDVNNFGISASLKFSAPSSNSSVVQAKKKNFYLTPRPLTIFDNCFYNFENSSPIPGLESFGSYRSFFYYSNSYGLFFILPIFSPIKYSNAPWSGFLGKYFKSFLNTRITYSKSFIFPHNDIDYLLNIFIFRFLEKKKSFGSTADLFKFFASSGARSSNYDSSSASTLGVFGLWNFINGLKIVCNGRLNIRSTSLSSSSFGQKSRDAKSSARNAGDIYLINSSRKKSFEVQLGHIPNNSSTNIGIQPIAYRFKPFYTQKGSNSFHLYISYKNSITYGAKL